MDINNVRLCFALASACFSRPLISHVSGAAAERAVHLRRLQSTVLHRGRLALVTSLLCRRLSLLLLLTAARCVNVAQAAFLLLLRERPQHPHLLPERRLSELHHSARRLRSHTHTSSCRSLAVLCLSD